MVAVLLSLENEDYLERLTPARSSELREVLDAGKQQIREGRGIRHEDFWQEMETESRM